MNFRKNLLFISLFSMFVFNISYSMKNIKIEDMEKKLKCQMEEVTSFIEKKQEEGIQFEQLLKDIWSLRCNEHCSLLHWASYYGKQHWLGQILKSKKFVMGEIDGALDCGKLHIDDMITVSHCDEVLTCCCRKGAFTALHLAALMGHMQIVETLIKFGANVNSTNGLGWTPLSFSIQKDFTKIEKFLISKGGQLKSFT